MRILNNIGPNIKRIKEKIVPVLVSTKNIKDGLAEIIGLSVKEKWRHFMQIKNLKEQHRKINSLIEEINTQITNKDFPSNSQDIAQNISQLAGVLKIHLGSEDKFLYPRLKTASDIEIRTLAERYDREMGDLSQAYSEFKDKYNTKSKLNADSVAFKNEYNVIVERLKTRITKEDNELYPIAEKL